MTCIAGCAVACRDLYARLRGVGGRLLRNAGFGARCAVTGRNASVAGLCGSLSGSGTRSVRWATALAAPIAIGACTMIPEGVSEADIARYDAAVESLGCTIVTEPDYLAAGLQTGLARAQLLDITNYKLSTDAAQRLPAGGVRLTTGACA